MARTKNTGPTPNPKSSSPTPNFVLVCDAKPLRTVPARVKHVANRKIQPRWVDSPSNIPSSNPPEPSTNMEEESRTPSREKEEMTDVKKNGSSTKQNQSTRKPPTRANAKKGIVIEESHVPTQSSRKRKTPEESKWRKKSIVVGITYLPEEIKSLGWDTLPFLNFQVWGNMVSLDDLLYEEQIRQFYSNARFKMHPLEITSKIGDMEFTVNAETVGKALAIPNQGSEIYEEGWNHALGISAKELRNILLADPSGPIEASNLKPMVRIFHHMSSHTLLPRGGTHDKVTFGDQIILYHLMEKKSLNLPFLIMNHMISAIKAEKSQNSLPYGKALTKIFHQVSIPLTVREGVFIAKSFTSRNLKLMGLTVIEESARKEKKKKETVSSSSDDDNETLAEALRKERRTKHKHDPKGKDSAKKGAQSKKSDSKKTGKSKKVRKDDNSDSFDKEMEKAKELSKKELEKVNSCNESFEKELEMAKALSLKEMEKVRVSKDVGSSKNKENQSKTSPEREATEVLDNDSSTDLSAKTVELPDIDVNDGIEVEQSVLGEEINLEVEQSGIVSTGHAEKGDKVQDKSEKSGNTQNSKELGKMDNIPISQTNHSSPINQPTLSSPITNTPLPKFLHDQMPTLPPFSPSTSIPQNQVFPIQAIPLSFAPPSEPPTMPTITRTQSNTLESLVAALDFANFPSPLKTSNTITTSNLNQFLNLNQTPQKDSPHTMYPETAPQTLPSDVPSVFGSLDSTFLSAGKPSGTAKPKENTDEKSAPHVSTTPSSSGGSTSMQRRMNKLEKDMGKVKKMVKSVLEGQVILQQAHRAQVQREEQFRQWIVQQNMPHTQVPNLGPLEQFPDVPNPETSSSSDGSSPSQ